MTPDRGFRRMLKPLKPVLVPIWNEGHRLGWRLRDLALTIGHRSFDRCTVCGRWGPMLYRPRVVPPRLAAMWGLSPDLARALARKESGECFACGAKLRVRRMAEVLLRGDHDQSSSPPSGPPCRSLRDWAATSRAAQLAIAEINRIDGLHEALAGLPGLRASDFHDPRAPGTGDPAWPHEDLMRLSYPDASFDLVLTSETLEHVPDLSRALAEIHRVLKPGGLHVFTIPLLPGIAHTFTRARMGRDGSIESVVPPLLHHPGGDTGYPVFTEFGADAEQLFRDAGFSTQLHNGPPRYDDLAQVWVCRKPGPLS